MVLNDGNPLIFQIQLWEKELWPLFHCDFQRFNMPKVFILQCESNFVQNIDLSAVAARGQETCFWHTLIWTKWLKVSPFEPVCVWFCNKLHFMSVCVADSHLINEDIWFPEDFSRNCDMSNSTKLIRVPWDAFIIPYLQ